MDRSEVLTIDDVRAAGHCVRGCKKWCEQNGIDFRDALKNGVPISRVEEIGDALGLQILQRKREREHGGRRR